MSAFGVPRTTADVDIIVGYRVEEVPKIAASFRREGFRVKPEDLRDALDEGSHATVHDVRSPLHLGLAPATRPRGKDAIRHAIRIRWRGILLPIADPEHTIVMKLVYGSEQDTEDALGIYVRQRKRLNFRRMREFARQEGALTPLRDLERKATE